MIYFRCPSCDRRYLKAEAQAGQRLTCSCQEALRVPKKPGQSPLYRSWTDLAALFGAYGGCGGLLGLYLGVAAVTQPPGDRGWSLLVGTTVGGMLAGGRAGAAGIDWVGWMSGSHKKE